jgi:nuclear-control-of-ATPase protein 2
MRYWFPLLFLPPAVYTAVQTFAKNKDWMKEQVVNAKETVRGFVVQWVWEPLEGIGKTIRGGGEGLGVAPTTVQSDQDSLERMVLDLGRDYYKLSGPQLEDLGRSVKAGDMEQVLRVYEREMQVSPIVVYS